MSQQPVAAFFFISYAVATLFFIGWGILRVLAVAPVLGILVWIAASLYGLGMLAVAAFRAGQVPHPTAAPTAAPESEVTA